jgi:LysR family transcriptional regulator, nitrogen assimilation regulatory protein
MDLRTLRYFLAVAETRSFSRAATAANISQPALSRQVQLLERELGTMLFERHGRGVHLTDAGRLLQESAQSILNQVTAVREQVAARASVPAGPCGLAIPPSLQTMITVRVAQRMRTEYPSVYMRIAEGMTMLVRELVSSGAADVGLISTVEPAGDLNTRPLLSESLFLVGPIDSGLRVDKSVPVGTLADVALVVTPPRNSLRQLVDRALGARGLTARPVLEATMHPLLLKLVANGFGYTVLPYCSIREPLAERFVSGAPIRGLRISWLIATVRDRPLSLAVRTVAAVVEEEARAAIARGEWLTAKLAAPAR